MGSCANQGAGAHCLHGRAIHTLLDLSIATLIDSLTVMRNIWTWRALTSALTTALLLGCRGAEMTVAPVVPVVPTPPAAITVPTLPREFRGLWIATVGNIDWPSRTGLTVAAQQAELTAILDLARTTGLNAIVLQVRASGDALFPSVLEPWTKSFSGTQGVSPGWDPLAFAVTEAHERGLELHAWFNPFRAANLSDSAKLDAQHLAKRRPDLTRVYCSQLWFDPGEPAVQDQAITVIDDVVRRYDVDAVHLDDFFYPYPETRCPNLDFPDTALFARYRAGGGAMAKDDWRRDNVNRFVERLAREVHGVRATTRVGISPFGIWRPGNPVGVVGLDSYATLFADSRTWLQRGWVDYLAPQLYWSIASTGQSFPALVDWWSQQNAMRRHFWPGLAAYRVSDGSSSAYTSSEIVSQVTLARTRSASAGGPTGTVLYNTSVLKQNRDALASSLRTGVYADGAVVPATPWLDATVPSTPTISVTTVGQVLRLSISGDGGKALAWWAVRWRNGSGWTLRLVPSDLRSVDIPTSVLTIVTDAVVIQAIDRVGNASVPALWRMP